MIKAALFIGLLLLALTACTGLGGEPAIVRTIAPPTPVPTEPRRPSAPIDVARGAAVFAANCTRCHGANGNGNGELVVSGQVGAMASFLDPATTADQTPADFFATITQGRIEKLMPPWREALSYEDRWAVALYSYTLHYSQAQLAEGRRLYEAECAECHDLWGTGDGDRVDELPDRPADLSDPAGMSFIRDAAIGVSIAEGIGDIMPAMGIAYGGTWTDEQVASVAAYVRTLSLEGDSAIGLPAQAPQAQAPTEVPQAQAPQTPAAQTPAVQAPESTEAVAAPSSGITRVVGALTNGSAGGTVPASAAITVFAIDPAAETPQRQFDLVADASGAFSLDDVPYSSEGLLVATTSYRDRVFASALLRGDDLAAAAADGVAELPITLYELTDDASVISIAGMVAQVSVVGDSLEIAQVFNISNTSDRAFTTADLTSDGRPISVALPLPPGALVASLMGGENRFVIAPDNSAVLDTQMVLPNTSHIVNVIYLVQYGGGAIIEQVLPYAFDGQARVLVRPPEVALAGANFPPAGREVIGQSEFAVYGGTLNLPAGGLLRYDLTGDAASAGTVDRGSASVVASNILPLVLVAAGVLVALIGLAVYVIGARNRAADAPAAGSQIDALAGLIADLDGDYAAGKLDAEAYQTQRAALKARMARLLAEKGR